MIYHSPYPEVEIPIISLIPFILRHAARLGDKPALIDGLSGRTLTYGQLADGVRRVASSLARCGFRKGDIFATVCPSVPELALALYGVATLGGATTTLNPLFTARRRIRSFSRIRAARPVAQRA
jgi:acyl-CoA synthetase (AMP-forming)/AMP-acid ligase II